uniref:Immunoglobulin V-set domain-containing protein n=2 Tax=Seriola lalandi dorsalis TaxID=1841481 RepID=A0A3B4Y0P7_SERLL
MISWTSLLVLCSVLSPALCCDWLRHYGHYSNISLTLIRLMGGQLTEQDSPVSFPYKFYKHIRNSEVRSKVVFIRDSLVQISDLYRHDNLSSVTWDMDNTNRFRMSIDRQIDGLNTCVSTEQRADNSLRKYYRRLRTSTLDRTVSTSTVNTDCNTVCTDCLYLLIYQVYIYLFICIYLFKCDVCLNLT